MLPLDFSDFVVSGVLAQGSNWWAAFVTPLFVLATAITLGAIASAAIYGGLALLSFVAPLGHLADDRRRGLIASLLVGGVLAVGLCALFVPRADDERYAYFLYLPLIVLGLIGGFGIVYGMWHRTRREWPAMLGEGIVPYLLGTAATLAVLGWVALPWSLDADDLWSSIPQVNLLSDGTQVFEVDLPGNGGGDPDAAPFVPADITYDVRSLSSTRISTSASVLIGDGSDPALFSQTPTAVYPDEDLTFDRRDRERPPLPANPARLHLQNREASEATVRFTFTSVPQIPEATAVVVLAVMFVVAVTILVAFRQGAPRAWALALSTAKNEMAQPLYLLLLGMGIFVVLVFGFFPFNTLGDDIRLLKDSGVTLIMILGMLQAVWSAGTSVAEEIEGRTALTVLSKPVSRRTFILGKYAGIMLAVLVLFAVIAAVLLVVVAYKPIYDSRETTRAATTWQEGWDQMMSVLPVLGLYFMETCAIGAVAVALATRMPLLGNFLTCFVIYIVGHLTGVVVAAGGQSNDLVEFVGQLIAVVVPNLGLFNVQSAIDAGRTVPILYVAAAFNYLVCFVIAIWMVAMLLFEERDLA